MSIAADLHRGPWTIADVEAIPETGERYEILAPGVLTASPAPGLAHQRASRHLANLLEIVSPASKATDRAIKPDLYAEAGIPVFLRVDLEPSPQANVHLLDGTAYRLVATLIAGVVGSFDQPFPVRLDPADLIARRSLGEGSTHRGDA